MLTLHKNKLPLSILAILLTGIAACSGGGSGGEVTELLPEVEVPVDEGPQTFIIEHAAGSNALQQALDGVRAGDTIIIRAGADSYASQYRFPGESLRGFTLANSGTAEAPIRIIGEAAGGFARPVIDQGKTAAHDPAASGVNTEPTAGLYLLCASHVVIENLEIRNVHVAGITTSLGACETRDIHIAGSHIHHVYGDRHVAAIRLSRASDVTISNNDLHDVYQTDSDREEPLISGSSEQSGNILIANNRFTKLHSGVRVQAQHDKSVTGIAIIANHFEGLQTAVTALINPLDESTPAIARLRDIVISDNLLLDSVQGVAIDAGESQSQSSTLAITNNTFYQFSEAPLRFSAVDAVTIYNNIFSHINRDLLITTKPFNAALNTAISEYDHNLYWHVDYSAATGPEWLLDVGGDDPRGLASFDDWRMNYSAAPHSQLIADPDQASQFADPQFNDVASGDFTPALPFALTGGRDGDGLGAFRDASRPGLE